MRETWLKNMIQMHTTQIMNEKNYVNEKIDISSKLYQPS